MRARFFLWRKKILLVLIRGLARLQRWLHRLAGLDPVPARYERSAGRTFRSTTTRTLARSRGSQRGVYPRAAFFVDSEDETP
jgi:hypothetical protein